MSNKFTKFMSGKGFYLALALCLIGTGTAAWVAVDRTLGGIRQNNSNILEQPASSMPEETWGFGDTEGAAKEQSGVNVSSAPSSLAPTAPSSLAPSAKPPQASASSAVPAPGQPLAYVLPVSGEIFGQYSEGKLVQDPTLKEWRTHNGIDVKAPKGTAVIAVADGTVENTYNDPIWGQTVEISHSGGLVSVYCGLSKELSVKKGQGIKMGQTIGTVDFVPGEVSLESHLHFAMKKEGKWVDPLATMNKNK